MTLCDATDPEWRGIVVALHLSSGHTFSKAPAESITLVAGMGVEGDVHSGPRVKHRSRVKGDPDQPNLRQVHLLHQELFQKVAGAGFSVAPGDLGENITTEGIDLLGLPVGAMLRIGTDALVVLAGLRNPCRQIDDFAPGLLGEVRRRDDAGKAVLEAGVMGVVIQSGAISPGDEIGVALPPHPHIVLAPV